MPIYDSLIIDVGVANTLVVLAYHAFVPILFSCCGVGDANDIQCVERSRLPFTRVCGEGLLLVEVD